MGAVQVQAREQGMCGTAGAGGCGDERSVRRERWDRMGDCRRMVWASSLGVQKWVRESGCEQFGLTASGKANMRFVQRGSLFVDCGLWTAVAA